MARSPNAAAPAWRASASALACSADPLARDTAIPHAPGAMLGTTMWAVLIRFTLYCRSYAGMFGPHGGDKLFPHAELTSKGIRELAGRPSWRKPTQGSGLMVNRLLSKTPRRLD